MVKKGIMKESKIRIQIIPEYYVGYGIDVQITCKESELKYANKLKNKIKFAMAGDKDIIS